MTEDDPKAQNGTSHAVSRQTAVQNRQVIWEMLTQRATSQVLLRGKVYNVQ